MILRKKMKIFSTLILALLLNLIVFAENPLETPDVPSDGLPADTAGITVLGGGDFRPEEEITSEGVYVYNLEFELPVYSKNLHQKIYPASTTKIMTALVVLEMIGDGTGEFRMDDLVSVPYAVTNEFWEGDPNKQGPANASFVPLQNNLTIQHALYGMMLPSGCEAANVLAYHFGKDSNVEDGDRIANFVKKMNEKAKQIGCENTQFANPHGLFEPGNYSTAYDMFLITIYAYDKHNASFMRLVGATEHEMPHNSNNPQGYAVYNSNQLIQPTEGNPYYYEFAKGIKTGGFDYRHVKNESGGWDKLDGTANLVSLAKRDDLTYLVVSMGATCNLEGGNWLRYAYEDHGNLYRWAFSTFEKTRIMQKTDPIGSVKVLDGEKDTLTLFPAMNEEFWTLLPRGSDVKSVVQFVPDIPEKEVEAPIAEGAILGTITILRANETFGPWNLITNESVERTSSAIARDRIGGVFASWWFIPLLVLIGASIIALIVLSYIRRHRKLQRDRFKRKNRPNRKIRR